MPRPKRTKVAPSAPSPRVRKASRPVVEVPVLAQSFKDGFNDIDDISDPDEAVVTSARIVKRDNGKGKGKATELETGSSAARRGNLEGGYDIDEVAEDFPGKSHAAPDIQSEESLLPEIDLDSSSPCMAVGRRDRSSNMAEKSILAIGNFKRRPRQPSILGRGAARARSSSVESNLAEDTGLMSVRKRNTSAIGNFKRRPREQSIMGWNAAHVRSSSMGSEMGVGTPAVGSAMRIGNFKRRAREPSILRTAQKERPELQRTEYDLDDEDDFRPDDESTPLNLSRSKATVTSSAGSSHSRKRKLSAVQVLQSQNQHSSPIQAPTAEDEEPEDTIPASGAAEVEGEEPEDEAQSDSEEIPLPSIERHSTPEHMSETMAPPQSSSPNPDSPPLPPPNLRLQTQRPPSEGRMPLRRRTPLTLAQDSPPSSPPSLTHSPNGPPERSAPKARAKKQPPQASRLSTAQLQALLPRRRRQTARDPFDIASEDEVDVSGLASDDDELTHSTVHAPPRRSMLTRPTALRKPTKPKPKPAAKGRGTYGRATTSDKENEETHDPDDSLGPLPDDEVAEDDDPENSQEVEKRVGKELKRAARKFEEVDKWELDFEDCTASSSSPRDAR